MELEICEKLCDRDRITRACRDRVLPNLESYLAFSLVNHPQNIEKATKLINVCPEVDSLRFALVSTRMKEDHFWMAFLSEYEQEVKAKTEAEKFSTIHDLVEQEIEQSAEQAEAGQDPEAPHPAPEEPLDFEQEYHRIKLVLQEREAEILALKQELKSLGGSSLPTTNAAKKAPHKGSWKVDPGVEAFFQLEAPMKEELRKKKALRLQQVEAELAWVAMDEDLTKAKGKWSCCNEEVFDRGCKQ